MLFGVLGPVAECTDRGDPVPVPGRKVRALLAILLAHRGRPVPAARLIDNLWGRSLRAALSAGGRQPAELRARANAWQAGIEVLLGEPSGPARERACEKVADPLARARVEWFLAYAETDLGDVPAIDERLDRALTAFHDARNRWGRAAVLSTRAKLRHLRADLKALERDSEQSAELFRELGDQWGLLQATGWLGGLAEMVGDYVKATRLHGEGLRMAKELGLWSEVSARLAWLGWIALQQCK